MKSIFFNKSAASGNQLLIEVAMSERFGIEETEKFILWAEQIKEMTEIPETITLNFSNTSFIDSSGIGAIIRLLKITRLLNIELKAIEVKEHIIQIFKLTRLDDILVIEQVQSAAAVSALTKDEIEPTHQSIQSYSKRMMDIAGSIVGLGITGLLYLPIAAAIKLESSGPVLFRQTRVGLMGRKFTIYKFRTMVNDAEAKKSSINNEIQGAIFKCKNDPRVTRVGKFLRKTSLDELPQFFNVLTGSMSLIGTRPPTVDELEKYNIPHWQRLDVKPGISGEWQVNGRSEIKNFEDIVSLDLRYQKNWSLLYDIKLIFKTIHVVFSKKSGAM
jgi:anti-anti-sigma factor